MVLFWCQIKEGGKRNGLLRSTIQNRQTASESKQMIVLPQYTETPHVIPEANPNPYLYKGEMVNCNNDN